MRTHSYAPVIPFIFLFLLACSSPGGSPGGQAAPSDSSVAKDFFPVPDFIAGQLKLIDSFQYPLTKIVRTGTKSDTSACTDQELRTLAENFRSPDLNDPAIHRYYTESSFADQTIPAITFHFSTTRPEMVIRKLDLIVHPDPEKSDKVNSIYLEKSFSSGDTLVSQKLFWYTDKSFVIVTSRQLGSRDLGETQVKLVWDPGK
jgi:hypothetical protein